ncbi:BatD family protein [Terrimonas sp. NA20]|uniref:BatD family protein n=1 Tax=Terrimonas ginsenosidimutans TaxID=2908004 RepID=A0ABS9KZV1_9BACT|nr:BatD family protein [Terrimonas ginsenosidimutans]MCG2617894.1 BatD family protein [Terrimonas ginsenosidimutans]
MTRTFCYRTIFYLIAIVLPGIVAAQRQTVAGARVDRAQILIGERIQLTLTADIPENQPIRFFQLDTIPHFEFLDLGKIDTVNTGSGTTLTQKILLTSFDSGHWVIPAFPLGEAVLTDSIPVDIGFSSFDPQQPYHDIKDIMDANPVEEESSSKLWVFIAGGVLLLILLYVLLRKPRKEQPKAAAPAVDPYRQAMDQLEKIRKEKLTPKAYYSGLTDVFRVYIEKRKGIHSLQQTTGDLVVQLKSVEMRPELYKELSETLQLSDFVKFARYETSTADDARAFETIKTTIDHIEQTVKTAVASATTPS